MAVAVEIGGEGAGGLTMSVLIRGMKTPENCDSCWALDEYGDYPLCRLTGEQRGYNFRTREQRMKHCPLIEVPTPHGRLGDLDRLYKDIKAECNIYGKPTIGEEDGNKVLKIITNRRTFIEAEESE